MKWWGVAAVTLTLTACGAVAENVAENVVENVVENAVEAAVESEAGGQANVDIDTSGDSMTFTVETPEGSQEMVFGGGEIPEGFPVPVPADAAVQSVISAGTEGSMVVVSVPAADFDSTKDLYAGFFADFDDTTTVDSPDQMTWSSEAGGASVILTRGDEEAAITIIAAG
jgi:hypothetical protein